LSPIDADPAAVVTDTGRLDRGGCIVKSPSTRRNLTVRLAAVGTAVPPHYYDQPQLLAALTAHWNLPPHQQARLETLHRNVLVGGRHLAIPITDYPDLTTWGKANDAWIRVAQDVGELAIRRALEGAGLAVGDIGAIFFVSVTGIATPSIDARLSNRMSFPPTVKRNPIFGLGCVAGAAGIARAADYVKAFPDEVAILLAVELCSLTLQREDLSLPNLIASGLFGDGAAAAVIAGDRVQAPGPRILATRSVFYPDTEGAMGWDISERGFKIVLDPSVPELARNQLPKDVDAFLAENGLSRADVRTWVCHPGGPKVLDAVADGLGLEREQLELSWRSLGEVGNLSSASVLFVMADTMRERPGKAGEKGVLLAMGPGFCSELVLFEW
jgi:alkylresorcinol/alkylpyrone synthase